VPTIILPRRSDRDRQPRAGVAADVGLVPFAGLWNGADIERNAVPHPRVLGNGTISGTVGKDVSGHGVGATFAASAQVQVARPGFLFGTQRSFAMLAVVRRSSAQLYRFAMRASGTITYDLTAGIGSEYSGAGKMVFNIGLRFYDEYEVAELVQLADNELGVYVGTWDASTLTAKLFKNGVLQNSLSYTSGSNSPAAHPISLGNDPDSPSTRNWNGLLYAAGYVDGLVGEQAAIELSRAAWRAFESDTDWMPIGSGGASYSLTCAAGSYALSGQAVALRISRSLVAGQGSYALTGQDVALLRLYTLTAAQGSYSLSGQALALTVGRQLAAGQGSYALTGQSVGLLASRVLAAGQGGYTLTGQAVGLSYTPLGSFTLLADSGSYALTGQAVGLLASRVLAAEAGSYGLSGQAVGLTYTPAGASYTLTADSGSYALAGQAVSFSRSYVLTAAPGSYGLTGRDVTLSYSGAPPISIADMVRTARGVARLAIRGTSRNVIRGYRP